jgi:hypothetical protein
MLSMLQAHGLDAGPTQRPLLAGAVSAVITDLPAIAVLVPFGSLDALGRASGIATVLAGLAYGGTMLLGGVLYGWLFQRAANDPRGGWLFGLAFGFVLWMLGPIPLLQWLPDRPILSGNPALGLLLGQLLWGLVLGVVFPFVHRRLHADLEERQRADGGRIGPEAVTRRLLCDQGAGERP